MFQNGNLFYTKTVWPAWEALIMYFMHWEAVIFFLKGVPIFVHYQSKKTATSLFGRWKFHPSPIILIFLFVTWQSFKFVHCQSKKTATSCLENTNSTTLVPPICFGSTKMEISTWKKVFRGKIGKSGLCTPEKIFLLYHWLGPPSEENDSPFGIYNLQKIYN